VFGVDAREAELLAALLDHHECVGPFYQGDPGEADFWAGRSGHSGTSLDEARPRIPAQAQAADEPRHDGDPARYEEEGSRPGRAREEHSRSDGSRSDRPQRERPQGEPLGREERPRQQWRQDDPPGPVDGLPDPGGPGGLGGTSGPAGPGGPRGTSGRGGSGAGAGLVSAGGDVDAGQPHYRDHLSPAEGPGRENGVGDLPRRDEARGSAGHTGEQRRGRRTEPGRPSRRERRAASRQRPGSAGTREAPAGAAQTDAAEKTGPDLTMTTDAGLTGAARTDLAGPARTDLTEAAGPDLSMTTDAGLAGAARTDVAGSGQSGTGANANSAAQVNAAGYADAAGRTDLAGQPEVAARVHAAGQGAEWENAAESGNAAGRGNAADGGNAAGRGNSGARGNAPGADITTVDAIPADVTAMDAVPADVTTVDAIPAVSAAWDGLPDADAAATGHAPDEAAPADRGAKPKSLYEVTKASRERARAERGRGAGQARGPAANPGRGESPELSQDPGRGAKPGAEPASRNGLSDASHPGLSRADGGYPDPGHAGPGHADASRPGTSRADGGYAGPGYTDPGHADLSHPGTDHPSTDHVGTSHAEVRAADAGLAGLGLTGPDPAPEAMADRAPRRGGQEDEPVMESGFLAAAPSFAADSGGQHDVLGRWADTDPGFDYADDSDLDYAGDDADRDYTDGAGWILAPEEESWGAGPVGYGTASTGPIGAEAAGTEAAGTGAPSTGIGGATGSGHDRDTTSGRSDVAGLDQLWGIGRSGAGDGQGHPDGGYRQAEGPAMDDAAGHGGFEPGTNGPGGAPGSGGASGLGPVRDASLGAGRDASRGRDAGGAPEPGQPRDTGSAPEPGSPRAGAWDERTRGGSAWEGMAREGAAADAVPERSARSDMPGAFGPDPLAAPGRGATADFLPGQGGSILTTAPRQNTRTARPAVATETIAAELAGWAAGELPGQASARLAAWAAIGGVPAPGYRAAEDSDVGAAGVGTERVR